MKKRERLKKLNISAWIIFALLTIYTISIVGLYLWAFFASLKTNMQFSQNVLNLPKGWPWEWAWDNYARAATEIKVSVERPGFRGYVYLPTMLWNSILFSIGGALVNNLTLWLVSYLLIRFKKYKLSGILYTLNIALMTIPVIGSLPAALAIYKALNWFDNYWFILFNNIGFTGMYLLIYCSFLQGLGQEYYEGAYIDGAGNFTIMTKIAFPLTSSMFFVVLLLLSITRWNDYMTMVIWMPNHPTLAYGIYKTGVSNSSEMSFPPLQIAICMVLMLPMLILFFCFQDAIMGNIRLGAIKG